MAEQFKKKVMVCAFEEAIASNKSLYAKLTIMAEDSMQYLAYYFGYAKTDKKYFDNPDHVYEVTGTMAADGSIKVTSIDLTDDKASDIIKPQIDVEHEKTQLMQFLTSIFTKAKYKKLMQSFLARNIDTMANASLFDFPFIPHSLIKHINQCLMLLQSILGSYGNIILDVEAMASAIILYATNRADTVANSLIRFEPSVFLKVAGKCESTMAATYNAIIDSGINHADFACMIDIISAIANERYSNTLEGRIVFHIVKMDNIIQMVQTRHQSSKQDGVVNVNNIDKSHIIYYPSAMSA